MTDPTLAFAECPDRCGAVVFPPDSKYAGRFHCGGCELMHETNKKNQHQVRVPPC